MPSTVQLVTSGTAQAVASQETAAFTPDGNQLYIAVALSRLASTPNTPTATGAGLTWTAIANRAFGAVSEFKISALRGLGASGSNGGVTFDFAAQEQVDLAWHILRVTSVSPAHASQGVVQSATGVIGVPPGTSLTLVLGAFGSTDNGTIGLFGFNIASAGVTPGAGFAELGETTVGLITLQSQWRNDNDLTVDSTFSSAHAGGIAVEIALGPASAATIGGAGFFPGGKPGYIGFSE